MADAGLKDVVSGIRVGAGGLLGNERLCLLRSYAEVKHQILFGEAVDPVLEVLDPRTELSTLFGGTTSCLVRKVGADVAIGEDDLAAVESSDDGTFVLEAVAGVEQGSEVRVNRVYGTEVTIEELASHLAEPGAVLREAGGEDAMASGLESLRKQANLSLFTAAVYAFDGDKLSASGHE